MTKKLAAFIMAVCILLGCLTVSASAAVTNNSDVSVMAVYYRTASVTLTISSDTARLSGSVVGYKETTTKTSVHLYLQKYSNGKWSNIADWSSTKNASSCMLSKTKALSRGKYRAKAVCKAYAGTKSETITKYSNVRTN